MLDSISARRSLPKTRRPKVRRTFSVTWMSIYPPSLSLKGEGGGEGEGRVPKKAGVQNKTTIAVGNRRLLSDLRTLNFPLSTFLPLAWLALTVGVFSLH